MQKNYFLIDICGTIFKSNTTFDFLKYFFSEKRWYKVIAICRKAKALFMVNAIFMRLFKIDLLRIWALRHIRGFSSKQLADMAEEFYGNYLKNYINEEVMHTINECKSDNTEQIIVSATLDCIAQTVAKHMGIENVYSSELAFADNKCQGYLKCDLLEKKFEVLTANGIKPPYWGIITDNYSDIKLIENSQQAFLIQYNNKPNRWINLLKGAKVKIKIITIYG